MAGRVTKRKVDMLSRRILFDDDSGPGMARRDCKVIVVWTSSSPCCVRLRIGERRGAHGGHMRREFCTTIQINYSYTVCLYEKDSAGKSPRKHGLTTYTIRYSKNILFYYTTAPPRPPHLGGRFVVGRHLQPPVSPPPSPMFGRNRSKAR